MTEYAPNETPKPKKSQDSAGAAQNMPPPSGRADGHSDASDAITADPQDRTAGATSYPHEGGAGKASKGNDMHLKPYKTLSDNDWDQLASADATSTPATAAHNDSPQQDPTSSLSKDEFATSNDPASPANQESKRHKSSNSTTLTASSGIGGNGSERKKSWFGQKYSSFQAAKSGKGGQISDEELKKYTGRDRQEIKDWAENRPGVAGNQSAGRVGTDNSLAAGQPFVVA